MSIAPFLQADVDGFCVATADEATELCRLAVYKPILIMGAIDYERSVVCNSNVIYTVCSEKDIEFLAKCDRRKQFYIKVNTGMNRLGCDPKKIPKILASAHRNGMSSLGVYTHFFCPEDRTLSFEQYRLFDTARAYAAGASHCCASNFTMMPQCRHGDVVRVGLSLYGYGLPRLNLKPAMSVCAPIVEIRFLLSGSYVGYGGQAITEPKRIAVLRAGYGDGYRRTAGKKRYVSVGGKRCPVIGNICMDMCMIDLSDAEAKIGDYAYLLGEGVSAEELAEEYGTVVHEVLTSFNDRVERIYTL